MIKLIKNIHNSINKLSRDQLILLYEQIKLMENQNPDLTKKIKVKSIAELLEMTKSSKSQWSDSVVEERADRI